MNIVQSVSIGLMELRSNKLRSFLTMLGVIFGVAAVIASVAIGEGARKEALEQMGRLGVNNIRIKPVKLEGKALAMEKQRNPRGLSMEDVEIIRKSCTFVRTIAPVKDLEIKPWLGDRNIKADIFATTPEFQRVTHISMKSGRFIQDMDYRTAARVCIVGDDIAETISGSGTPLGKRLVIRDSVFVIAGVLEKTGSGSKKQGVLSVRNMNRAVIIPISTAFKRLLEPDANELSEISIRIDARDHLFAASSYIERVLRRLHGGVDNFEVIIPLALLKQSQATQRRFNLVLAAIAGISLLVGGIGIMNIMLASVTQRIREIGIRRALGATKQDILGQFIIEALVLSLAGGILGIIVGIALGYAISRYAGWETVYSLKAIGLSFFVAATVGVVFGLYPARQAAKLNPIEALRYE